MLELEFPAVSLTVAFTFMFPSERLERSEEGISAVQLLFLPVEEESSASVRLAETEEVPILSVTEAIPETLSEAEPVTLMGFEPFVY